MKDGSCNFEFLRKFFTTNNFDWSKKTPSCIPQQMKYNIKATEAVEISFNEKKSGYDFC